MQIHELNNYEGSLGANAYTAIDNGSDTGKVSVSRLLSDVVDSINQLGTDLGGRIDNIIAGGDAPSAAEVTDARYGFNGVTYPSLGDSIRGQVSVVNNEVLSMKLLDTKYLFDWAIGGWGINGAGEANYSNGQALQKRRCCPHVISFDYDVTLVLNNPDGLYRMGVDTFEDYEVSKLPEISTGWVTCPVTIPANTEFSFSVSWVNEAASSDTTILYNELYQALSIVAYGDANDLRDKTELLGKDLGIDYIRPDFNPGYLNGGTIVPSAAYNYSQKIPVTEGDVIIVKASGSGATVLCLYDNLDARIHSINFVVGQTEYTLKVSQTGYVRVCSINSYADYLVTHIKVSGYIGDIIDRLDTLESEGAVEELSIKDIVDLKYNYKWLVGGWFMNGSTTPPTYSPTAGTSEQRVASEDYIIFDRDVTVLTDDNGIYRFADIYTADDANYVDEGWASYRRTLKAGRKYWITFAYITENQPDITDPYTSAPFKHCHIEAPGNIVDLRRKVGELYTDVPDYWQTEIDSVIDTVNQNAVSMGTNGDTFVFITDQHWYNNEQVSSRLIDYISEKVDLTLVMNGGDLIMSNNASKIGAINEIANYYKSFKKPHRIFSTIGNHDVNTVANTDPTTFLTEDELYPLMIKREEKFTDTEKTPLVNVFDNESQKIRYIQYCYYGQPVNVETADKLREAITEKDGSWTLVLMTHEYWVNSSATETNYSAAILNAMDESSARVACLLVGHIHDDKTTELTSPGGKKLRIISTSTDSWRQMRSAGYVPYTMTPGTITEQCFDVVQIDTAARKIKMTRVGVGSNRSFSY